VTEANFPERVGGAAVVMEAALATDNLTLIWVDQGFSGKNFERVISQLCAAKVDVVCRTEPGFQVLPKRWIVERKASVVESIPPPFSQIMNFYRKQANP
jgi:putative transposase